MSDAGTDRNNYPAARLSGVRHLVNILDSCLDPCADNVGAVAGGPEYDRLAIPDRLVDSFRWIRKFGTWTCPVTSMTEIPGQVLMQVPSNMFLNYFGRPSWYLGTQSTSGKLPYLTFAGFWTIAWGLVSALTSQVSTYGEIVACRFILGFVEAPFFPGVLL